MCCHRREDYEEIVNEDEEVLNEEVWDWFLNQSVQWFSNGFVIKVQGMSSSLFELILFSDIFV